MQISRLFLFVLPIAAGRPGVAQGPPTPPPHLPGFVAKPPAWLVADSPFDMVKFFQAPPPNQNAAPVYLDALLEFSPETASCFTEGPETTRRKAVAQARADRWKAINAQIEADPGSVSDAEIDAHLKEYEVGFARLAEAQHRPRCMFQPGISIESLLPHAQAARQVVRVVSLRVRRDVARGDRDRPIRDMATVLRLCRDLQPRGPSICHLVSLAMENILESQVIPLYLTLNGLTAADCDRLIKLLAAHEAAESNVYEEALRGEYVLWRSVANDCFGKADDRGIPAAELRLRTLSAISDGFTPEQLQALSTNLDRAGDAGYASVLAELNRYYRAQTEARSRLAYSARSGRAEVFFEGWKQQMAARPALVIPALVVPVSGSLDLTVTRLEAIRRGTTGLVALKRWRITRKGNPPDLASLFRAAGIAKVPTDPFDSRPFKLATVDGQPVIYSIGKDGKDDGGRVDWDSTKRPGDVLFRLK